MIVVLLRVDFADTPRFLLVASGNVKSRLAYGLKQLREAEGVSR